MNVVGIRFLLFDSDSCLFNKLVLLNRTNSVLVNLEVFFILPKVYC